MFKPKNAKKNATKKARGLKNTKPQKKLGYLLTITRPIEVSLIEPYCWGASQPASERATVTKATLNVFAPANATEALLNVTGTAGISNSAV
ncbi:MAG: hypothetical protein LBE31_12340, partial [Deltaproteobacteria bacterium]|nr:hypothetical protein [Deltaproteobacteria bacterium]